METVLAVAALMGAVWLISVAVKDASIVDLAWGFGFVVIAWTAYLTAAESTDRALMLTLLASVWGLRLTLYLAWRNLGKGEDYRYRAMRRKYGNRFWIVSLFTVFVFQGVLMWLVSAPVQFGMAGAGALGVLDGVGVTFWATGLLFESIGDWQLAEFKADPRNDGQVLRTGLWRYTRHPNYFGDFMVWWGLYLIGAAGGAWWAIFGPLIMTALLMRYSGAGLLEKTITTRRPGYEEYIRTTNAFFPGPPKA